MKNVIITIANENADTDLVTSAQFFLESFKTKEATIRAGAYEGFRNELFFNVFKENNHEIWEPETEFLKEVAAAIVNRNPELCAELAE